MGAVVNDSQPNSVLPATYCGGCGAPGPILPGDPRSIVTCVVCLCPLRKASGPVFYDPIDPADLTGTELVKYIEESARILDAKR